MYIDEGPSEDDLQRFGDDSGYCPRCGEQIWDNAEVCPACGDMVGGKVSSRNPIQRERRKQMFIVVAVIVLIAFLIVVLL